MTSWQTVNEVNTKSFSVQRSIDGSSFNTIETLKSLGNSRNNNNYNYLDANISALNTNHTLYYRLEMTDNDNKKTFSNIIKVVLAHTSFVFSLSPNPTNGTVYVKGENISQVIITDLAGKNLIMQPVNSNSTSININKLSKGVYFVKACYLDGSTTSKTMIVQ